jgi:hypothetical protein
MASHECSVCFDVPDEEDVYKPSCGHVFHNACMTQWLSTNNTCPVCRHKIGERSEEDEEDEEEETEENVLLIDYSKAYNDPLTQILENFIDDAVEFDEDYWLDGEDGFKYVSAFSQRKINGRNSRIFTLIEKYTIGTKTVFMAEIDNIQDISRPHTKRYQTNRTKKTKISKNFNYHRNRRNFVGKRYSRT